MNTIYPWNAIYTHANCEKRVSKLLERKKIVHYFPENKVMGGESDHKIVPTALFPSIIFIQVSDSQDLSSLAQLPNVTNLAYWRQSPAVFPAAEINLLRNFMETHETVQVAKTDLCKASNANAQHTHTPHHFSADNIHTINLPSIGYSLSAKAEPITNIKLVRKNVIGSKATNGLAFILGFKINSGKFE